MRNLVASFKYTFKDRDAVFLLVVFSAADDAADRTVTAPTSADGGEGASGSDSGDGDGNDTGGGDDSGSGDGSGDDAGRSDGTEGGEAA